MRLHTIESAPGGNAGAGTGAGATPAVLVHGLFGQARNLGRLQRRLAQGRRVVAVDLRSHGDSPRGPLDPLAMGDDLAETMAALGIGAAILVGHSLGGKAAMALALRHPARVARLLVADIAPVPYRHGNVAYVRALQGLALAPGLTRGAASRALEGAIPAREVRDLLQQNLVPGDDPRWRLGLDEIAASLDLAEGWPPLAPGTAYDGRALFLRGGRSDYVQPAHRPAIRLLFPRAAIVTLHDAGHWLHVDRPAAFEDIVESFAAGADADGAGAAGAVTASPRSA